MKNAKYFGIGLLVAVATALGAVQPTSAYWTAPTLSNQGYCQNTIPTNFKTTLTSYGYVEGMDLYVGCTNNAGRDIAYVFGPELKLLVGANVTWNTETIPNRENIFWNSANSSNTKIIYQNFYNGQWYDYTSYYTATVDGKTNIMDNPFDNHRPLYYEGQFDLYNPFGITDLSNYQTWLTTPAYDPILSWGFEVQTSNKKINIIAQAGKSVNGGDIVKFEFDYDNTGNWIDPNQPIQQACSVLKNIEFGCYFQNSEYYYQNYGTYTIKMRVTDNNGMTAESSQTITVNGNTSTFTSDLNGGQFNQTYEGYFDKCQLNSTFPYFDIPGCISGLGKAMGIMKLDNKVVAVPSEIKMNNIAGCRQLTVIDDWLNLSNNNKTICPQIPSSVRDVVSPFVGFGLGLLSLGFLIRHGVNEGAI